jgi:hypothetical protein
MRRNRRLVAVMTAVQVVLGGAACGELPPEEKAARRAQGAIATLRMRLGQRLQAALADGAAAAVEVCAREAGALREAIARDTGVRLGRASLRRRNPAPPAPAWVTGWLEAQGERSAEGVAGLVEVSGGTARVLEPIAIAPVCVTCHGGRPGEAPRAGVPELSPAVAEALGRHYPGDAATGYAVGDLRGAFWAEADY